MDNSIQMKSGVWALGDQIGDRSGMGQVFEATKGDETCAIKIIDEAGPQVRDILANEVPDAEHVMPILETAEQNGRTFIRMPLAEYSLGWYRQSSPDGKLPVKEAVVAIRDIAAGLASIGHQVTHRDIKPENVLWYESRWCLTDFGLARISDATTATLTKKGYRTLPYWAPELINGQRASEKSDVYALGVTAFLLVTGTFPFADANPKLDEDVRQWHLTGQVPRLTSGTPQLDSLIFRMLMKAPDARPSARTVRDRAASIADSSGPTFTAMEALHQVAAERDRANAEEDRKRAEATAREDRRHLLAQSASSLGDIFMSSLRDNLNSVSGIDYRSYAGEEIYRLGQGVLTISPTESVREVPTMPFDVISVFSMRIAQDTDQGGFGWNGRQHSLWFCDAEEEGAFDWYETAFARILGQQRPSIYPYALSPLDSDAQSAFSRAVTSTQVARKLLRVDDDNSEEFVNRWIQYFTQAAQGELPFPMTMPEGERARWRAD